MKSKEQLRLLIESIKKETGMTQQEISEAAGYEPKSLTQSLSRSNGHEPVIKRLELIFGERLKNSTLEHEHGTTLANNDKTRNDMYTNSTTYHLPAQVIYDTVNNMIKNKEITVARLSEETRIPQYRMYKWFSENPISKPVKAQDLETLQAFLQKHNAIKQLSFPRESNQLESFPAPETKEEIIPASKYIAMLERINAHLEQANNRLLASQESRDAIAAKEADNHAAFVQAHNKVVDTNASMNNKLDTMFASLDKSNLHFSRITEHMTEVVESVADRLGIPYMPDQPGTVSVSATPAERDDSK